MLTEKAFFYRHIDDLYWALSSPPLFAHQLYLNPESPWSSNVVNEFLSQPIQKAKLAGWLGRHPSKRLGTYFEQLIHYYLERCPLVDDVTRSVALRDEQKTLGELDFIYRIKDQRLYTHAEVAVKFYLGMDDLKDPNQWLGLNPSDTLGKKVTHVLTHQLPVADTAAARNVLQRLAVTINHSEALIKGRLFYPWEQFNDRHFSYPEEVTAEHLKGWWVRLGELGKITNSNASLYPLNKNYWMAKLSTQDLERIQPLVQNRFELIYPLMVARVNPQGRELDRGVILPDNWPKKPFS